MKIVQLITAYQLGGAEKVALDISEGLQDNFKIEFISIFKSNDTFSQEFKTNLNNKQIIWKEIALTEQSSKFKYISLLYSSIYLFFYLIKNKIHTVHSHTDLPDFVLANVLKLYSIFGVKKLNIIRTIHNTELWPTHFKTGKYVESSFHHDHVVHISKGAQVGYENLRKRCLLSESSRQYFISNGVDLELFRKTSKFKLLEGLNIKLNKEKVNLLFVGRFVRQKGFDILIETFKSLTSQQQERFQIYAYGKGEMENLVDDSIPIQCFEPIHNIHEIYQYFDYLIMPSRFEGLGLVSLEASASKLPVIAAYSPGLKETLPDNWELFFKNESSKELEKLLVKISNNVFDVDKLGIKSLTFIEKNFNLNKTISEYKKLYTAINKENI